MRVRIITVIIINFINIYHVKPFLMQSLNWKAINFGARGRRRCSLQLRVAPSRNELGVGLLGLTAGPTAYPVEERVYSYGAHLAYGLPVVIITRLLDKLLP